MLTNPIQLLELLQPRIDSDENLLHKFSAKKLIIYTS